MKKKCTRQFALSAERNVKSPSNLMAADQYTAENVIPSVDRREEDIKLTC